MAEIDTQDAIRERDLPVAIAAFTAAGLHPERRPSSFCDLSIGADLGRVDEQIQTYGWICWLTLADGQWQVMPPPHPAPGPGPVHTVANIDLAVSLVLYLAAHRQTVAGTGRQQFERAAALHQQWLHTFSTAPEKPLS